MTCAHSSEDLPDRAEHVQRPEGSPHPRGSAAAGTAREDRREHAEVRPERARVRWGPLEGSACI